jgi:hypothetical protein
MGISEGFKVGRKIIQTNDHDPKKYYLKKEKTSDNTFTRAPRAIYAGNTLQKVTGQSGERGRRIFRVPRWGG